MRVALLVVVLAGGCSASTSSEPSAPRARTEARRAPAAEPAPEPTSPTPSRNPQPSPAPACELGATPEIVHVDVGRTVTSRSGVAVTFVGISHDDYDDGRFEVLATLRFTRGTVHETRMVSVLAPESAQDVVGHCWRLVRANDQSAEVALSALAAPAL